MIFALGVAVLSVLAGALLGLAPRARTAVGPVQSFAVVAAAVVVFGQLLPSAMGEVGWAAVALFLATLGAMMLPEHIARRIGRPHDSNPEPGRGGVGLEVGFAGLVVHTIGDGVGLGAYGGAGDAGSDRIDVVIAIAGHTVPLVAAVVIAFASVEGRLRAMIRSAVLALAAAAGVALTAVAGSDLLHESEPWISSVVAALLLHVVAHGTRLERPRDVPARLLELGALVLGVALLALGDHGHDGHHSDVRSEIGQALWGLTLSASPAVLVAAISIAALSRAAPVLPSWLRPPILLRSPWRRELGLTSALLALAFLGPAFAAWRWLTGIALSLSGRWAGLELAAEGATPLRDENEDVDRNGSEVRAQLDRYGATIVPRALIVLLAAAYAEVLVAEGSAGSRGWLAVIVAGALAIIPPLASIVGVPLVAVLAIKGWPPAAVLVALGLSSLVLGGWATATRGWRLRPLALGTGITIAVASLSGLAYGALAHSFPAPLGVPVVVQYGSALLFAAACLRVVYREGVVGFVSALVFQAGGHHREHDRRSS